MTGAVQAEPAPSTREAEEPRLERLGYTVKEGARLLGCPEQAIYDGIRAGMIPAIKIGPRSYRLPKRAFHAKFDPA
jgi:excisionase family DNA binding protein